MQATTTTHVSTGRLFVELLNSGQQGVMMYISHAG